jgi:protein-S-isoprenylcysteine O-methyltransferase Ste14
MTDLEQAGEPKPVEDAPLYGDRSRVLGIVRTLVSFLAIGVILALADSSPRRLLLGLPFILVGEWFHSWGHGHLIKTKELITSGPYAYTQNPLYLGRILMVTGFFIAIELPYHLEWVLLAVAWAAFLGYYMPRKTRVEGRRLRSFHGAAWEDYNRSVPVLFPSLQPYPKSVEKPFSASVMLGRNREYGMYLGLAIMLAILAYKAFD